MWIVLLISISSIGFIVGGPMIGEDLMISNAKRATQGFEDVEGVCQYFHRKCLLGENSNEKCEEPLKECHVYGKMLLRGSYKLCMYMLMDSNECHLRQLQIVNKLARDIHRGKVPFIVRNPSRRSNLFTN